MSYTQEDCELVVQELSNDSSILFWNKGSGQKIKEENYWKDSQSHVNLGTLYIFKQRLPFKSQEYPWCNVIICNEAYTSIGTLNPNLGAKKTFVCPSCHCKMDRDVEWSQKCPLEIFN
jgi:hypothetical protein